MPSTALPEPYDCGCRPRRRPAAYRGPPPGAPTSRADEQLHIAGRRYPRRTRHTSACAHHGTPAWRGAGLQCSPIGPRPSDGRGRREIAPQVTGAHGTAGCHPFNRATPHPQTTTTAPAEAERRSGRGGAQVAGPREAECRGRRPRAKPSAAGKLQAGFGWWRSGPSPLVAIARRAPPVGVRIGERQQLCGGPPISSERRADVDHVTVVDGEQGVALGSNGRHTTPPPRRDRCPPRSSPPTSARTGGSGGTAAGDRPPSSRRRCETSALIVVALTGRSP